MYTHISYLAFVYYHDIPLSNPVKPIKTQYINLLILYIEGVLLLHYSLKILNTFFNISLLYAINPISLK